ncbi:hypothetical protein [Streptomyces sp. NPDC085540]|uniref:hypothetical protein n=1 Tax=Streptomyces sp. NPDC085540 TaxID=3365730 RepID=UPI0037D25B61
MGERATDRRLAVVLWSALVVEAAGLVGTVALADTTVLVPEWDGFPAPECAVLLCISLAILPIVVAVLALRSPRNTAAVGRAAASWFLALALLITLARAGSGPWVVWCGVAMVAACVATVICSGSPSGLPQTPSRVAAGIAVIGLVAGVSGSCSGPYTDYPGVWTASTSDVSLTLTDPTQPGQGAQYTLRIGTCTEQGSWAFDYPQMSTSVQLWLHREGALACIPGDPATRVHLVGGNRKNPVITLTGLRLTKQ